MKILQVFNQYRTIFNGEQMVVERTEAMLRDRGIQCEMFLPSSRDIASTKDKVSAFFSGIYSFKAEREMRARLKRIRPDLVHCHNLLPLLSPSVMAACRKLDMPVVFSVHNQGLTCPTADHMRDGQMCTECYGGRELRCVANNCRANLVESIGYALRSKVARSRALYAKNATLLIALTDFARKWIAGSGYDESQIEVLHNCVEKIHTPVDPASGEYVMFAGRLSPEKDVATLTVAAQRLPGVRFCIAGSGPVENALRAAAPPNVEFLGRIPPEEMAGLYRGARCLVLPSRAFEMCPLVISEAMSHGLPVVASAIGGIDELVDQGVTGFMFEPGNPVELAAKIGQIFTDDTLARELGMAGHQKAVREFSEDVYFEKLLSIYRRAAVMVHGEKTELFRPVSKVHEVKSESVV